ncbi:MAG: ATP-binding protein [Anaerolineae bacterium]
MQQTFDSEQLPPILIDATQEHMPCHQILQEKTHAFQAVERETDHTESRFVGHTYDLEQLQFALETTIESHSAQLITVTGSAGIGKSRLRREFEKYLAIQPTPVHLFKGTPEKGIAAVPYTAIHRAFANFFDIHRRSSPQIARNKLIDDSGICLSGHSPVFQSHHRREANGHGVG